MKDEGVRPIRVNEGELLNLYVHHLTKVQRQVVELAVEGLSNERIGINLFTESSTIAWHLTAIYGEMRTLEALANVKPNRLVLIRVFALFFERHPELRSVTHSDK